MEPVIQGAGGMHMIDPLFQRVLVKECRSRKIPVIFDEVFTGFWRLGVEVGISWWFMTCTAFSFYFRVFSFQSAAEMLGCVPDIACFAKLLTGGVIPLSVTLATNDVFNSFKGDSKGFRNVLILQKVDLEEQISYGASARVHGHSYSAHAMGCTAAVKAIQWFKDPLTNLNMAAEGRHLKELWDVELVNQISSHPFVQRVVVALGTVCALELCTEGSDVGYGCLYATSLIRKLREDGIYMRLLGNVIYPMCGPCTSLVCNQLLNKVYERLHEFSQAKPTEVKSLAFM
ncbi:hypothetical protein GIB67_026585 [Kingdonia uniflora]|uniref:Uncharacterized protein n=1 Tax=Kingdonia uniflora TaxID=39325 RepID=A0A7J7NND2_9MAGN|nr:hypothetical protein GIB67_026585 [Kingdonia uniflora]